MAKPSDLCKDKARLSQRPFTAEASAKHSFKRQLYRRQVLAVGWEPQTVVLPRHPFMAATVEVIWLCACVRYWPYRGVGTFASVLKLVLFTTVLTTWVPYEMSKS